MPCAGKDNDASSSTVNSVAFLETNIGMYTTFSYDPAVNLETDMDTARMRMCVKATGFNAYYVDMPVRNVLRYTNANNLLDATGLLTLAACAGALNAFVMHNNYWATSETGSALGEPTPFRGIPIIDASKMVIPITNENFLAAEHPVSEEGKKARITVDMGFKTFYDASSPPTDTSTESGMVVDALEDQNGSKQNERIVDVLADIALLPRSIKSKDPAAHQSSTQASTSILKATDFRLAPHGAMNMEVAHVMTFFCKMDKGEGNAQENFTIMNVNYNAAPNVGGSAAPVAGN